METVRTKDGLEIFFKDWGPRNAQPIVLKVSVTRTERRQTVEVDRFRMADNSLGTLLVSHNALSIRIQPKLFQSFADKAILRFGR